MGPAKWYCFHFPATPGTGVSRVVFAAWTLPHIPHDPTGEKVSSLCKYARCDHSRVLPTCSCYAADEPEVQQATLRSRGKQRSQRNPTTTTTPVNTRVPKAAAKFGVCELLCCLCLCSVSVCSPNNSPALAFTVFQSLVGGLLGSVHACVCTFFVALYVRGLTLVKLFCKSLWDVGQMSDPSRDSQSVVNTCESG